MPVGPYRADIPCFSERLVIEVVGDTHAMPRTADAQRRAMMARAGHRTLHIANADVAPKFERGLTQISPSVRKMEAARAQLGKDQGSPSTKRGSAA